MSEDTFKVTYFKGKDRVALMREILTYALISLQHGPNLKQKDMLSLGKFQF